MSLREWLIWLKSFIKLRYVHVIICVLLFFVLPEYISPLFAVIAAIISFFEAKSNGQKALSFKNFGKLGKMTWIFVALMAVTIFWATNKLSTVATLAMWIGLFLIYIALSNVITDNEKFKHLMQLLTITMGVMGFIACIQYFLVNTLGLSENFLHFWYPVDNLIAKIYPFRSYVSDPRPASVFMNPNVFAEIMVCLIPFGYYAIGKAEHEGTRTFYIMCVVLGIAGVGFSFSRASYICIGILVILTMIFILPRLTTHQGRLLVFVVAAIAIFILVTPNVFMDRLKTIRDGDVSIWHRFTEWQWAIEDFLKRPFWGYGAGVQNVHDLMLDHGMDLLHAHNIIFELLLEGGVFLLASFVYPIVIFFKAQIGSMFAEKRNNLLGFCMFTSMIMLLVFGMTDFPLLTPKLIGLVWIMFAISDISIKLYKNEE